MNQKEHKTNLKVQWNAIEELESIANQCIYKGKEVAQARALLKSLYNINPEYNDEENCAIDGLDDNSGEHPIEQ